MATAAAPVRPVLAVTLLLSLVVLLAAGRADGRAQTWSAYLAPAGVCAGADDPTAPRDVQRRSIRCLVNWARARDGRVRLAPSPALQQAAALKGRGVAACGQLSHTPCNSDVTAAVRAAGYRYSTFGENLFLGPDGSITPRGVVAAWLRSPSHRANILRPGFRDVGVAKVLAPGFLGDPDSVVWIAAFGSRR